MEHEFAGRGRGVETLLEADQVDAPGLEIVDDFEQFPERASESVEANDAEAVTGSGVIDEFGQGRAVEALTRDDVGEDANGARLNEPVALGVGILVVGRDASVAPGVAHAGHRLNIVRFQDGLICGGECG